MPPITPSPERVAELTHESALNVVFNRGADILDDAHAVAIDSPVTLTEDGVEVKYRLQKSMFQDTPRDWELVAGYKIPGASEFKGEHLAHGRDYKNKYGEKGEIYTWMTPLNPDDEADKQRLDDIADTLDKFSGDVTVIAKAETPVEEQASTPAKRLPKLRGLLKLVSRK